MPLGNIIDIVGSIYAPEKDHKTNKPINHKKLQDVFNKLDSVINNDLAEKSDIPSDTEEQRYYDSDGDLIARDVYLETKSYSGNTITGIFRQENTGTNDSPVWETRYVFDQNDAGALHLNANTPGIIFPDGSQISSEDFNSSGQVTHADNADNADAYAGLVASNQDDEEIAVFTGSGVEAKKINDIDGASGRQVFTSDGTFTVPSGVSTLYVTGSGGGGGGGGGIDGSYAGGGGGSGQCYIKKEYNTSPGTDINVSIGTGGSGGDGSNNENGSSGADTSFGSLTMNGGGGGTLGYESGVAGGTAGGAWKNKGAGEDGQKGTPNGGDEGGDGGPTPFGVGGEGGTSDSDGENGSLYGSGGGGGGQGVDRHTVGGDGADGIVIVEWKK